MSKASSMARFLSAAFIVACLAPQAAHAETGDKAAGRKKVATICQTCHGLDGLSKVPDAPNLAGQNEVYLVAALSAYKSGERKNDTMSLVAPMLSAQDIANVAAYYSSIQITVTPPTP